MTKPCAISVLRDGSMAPLTLLNGPNLTTSACEMVVYTLNLVEYFKCTSKGTQFSYIFVEWLQHNWVTGFYFIAGVHL